MKPSKPWHRGGDLFRERLDAIIDLGHPLVRLSGLRWPIETGFEDGKQLLGMGDQLNWPIVDRARCSTESYVGASHHVLHPRGFWSPEV